MGVNMKEAFKMDYLMDLVFTPFQKKMQKTTMKVIGNMERNQEKECLSLKMELHKKESLKMIPLNTNQSILETLICVTFRVILFRKMSI